MGFYINYSVDQAHTVKAKFLVKAMKEYELTQRVKSRYENRGRKRLICAYHSCGKELKIGNKVISRMMHGRHSIQRARIVFLVDGKPLVERPRLGSDFLMFFEMTFPALANERYRIALRLGGAKTGKEVEERLLYAGISENEAVKRIPNFLEYCKV